MTIQWQHWSGGWTNPASDPNGNIVCIGPEDGNQKQRSCITVNLDALPSGKKRNKLKINLSATVVSRFGSSSGNDTIYARMTDEGPNRAYYSVQGSTLSTKSCNVDHSNSDIYPSWTFDISSFSKSAQTVYIYIYGSTVGDGIYGQYKIYYGNVQEETASDVPDVTPVTTNSITTPTGQFFKPSQEITVTWNAGSGNSTNSVAYYIVQLVCGSTTYEAKPVYGTSYTFSIKSIPRKTKIIAKVQAIGTKSGYDGSVRSSTIGVINSVPNPPTFTSSGTSLNSQNKIVYNVTAGSDDNNNFKTLCYKLNEGAITEFNGTSLEITSATNEVKSGTNSITFYTRDTCNEDSGPSSSHTFTATFAPIIGSISTDNTSVESMNGSTTTLVSETKIIFGMTSGTATNVLLYVRSGTSSSLSGEGTLVPSEYYSYNKSTGTITIPIISISTSLIAEGNYFQFAFKVSDGTTESNLSDWQTYKRRPKAPALPTYNNYSNHADNSYGATATNTFYKNYVTINFTNPDADAACAKISSISVVATYGSGSKEYACSTSSGSSSVEMDLSQVNQNTSTTFKFKVIDAAGQTKTSSNILTLTRTSNLVYGGSTVNVTNDNLKPMTNTLDFQIAHPIAQATGTPTIIYKYYMQIGSNKEEITDYTSTKETDQIKILITAANINALALRLVTDTNIAYDTVITILAADGFATTTTLTKTIKVNFTEPPSFLSSTFKIKHDYYTNRSSITTSTGIEVPAVTATNWTAERDKVMVNSGEGIIFVLPKATDPNDDISEYRIFLARNDFIDASSVLDKDEVTFGQTPWLTIPYTTLTKGISDTDYYYYLFKASQYTKNEYFYFKLQARDTAGNVSSEIICPNYIVGCRTVSPTFSTGNVRVDRVDTNVTLTYNFQITDLGGSAKSSGWDKTYYNYCPNFERNIEGYTPKVTLQVEIAPDQSFTTDVISASPVTFTPGDGKGLIDFTNTETKLSGFATSHAKIFMRFTLVVSYGLQDSSTLVTVTSVPQIYTYFGAVPTVAHRAHKVGINTNALGEQDVLVVENYQGTRYIRFKGTDAHDASQTYEITFDLLNGTITGAVIDCGEW